MNQKKPIRVIAGEMVHSLEELGCSREAMLQALQELRDTIDAYETFISYHDEKLVPGPREVELPVRGD